MTIKRAIFLDRDGVICENRADYVKSWAEFEFLLQAKTGLLKLTQLNLPIIIVTNQSAVGRGIITAHIVDEIHHRMLAGITEFGGRINSIYYCPHDPQANCNCRKPKPGLLYQAAQDLTLNLEQSYMVGDAATDLLAGQQVGCQTFLVLTGRGQAQLPKALDAVKSSFTIAPSLTEVADEIIKRETHAR